MTIDSALLLRNFRRLVALVCMLVGVAAATSASAAIFTYNAAAFARVHVHAVKGVEVSPAQLKDTPEVSAFQRVAARGASTTFLSRNITTEAGSLALNAGSEVSQWAGPTLSRVTRTEETMYRVWGGGSGQAGEWLTPINPASSAAARAGLALPEGNAATFVSEVLVPAGTRIQVGVAGEAFGQAGGWTQVRLLEEIPLSSFGKGVPLAP